MAFRRPLWPTPRLDRLAPPAIELRDPLRAIRPAVGRRRVGALSRQSISRFATVATPPTATVAGPPPPPPSPGRHSRNVNRDPFSGAPNPALSPQLAQLLSAIRRKNTAAIYSAFEAWTTLLRESEALSQELESLSAPQVSEIIRSLDPSVLFHQDVGGEIRVSRGGAQVTDAGRLVDEFGVRQRHRAVVKGMRVLMFHRIHSQRRLVASDYEVMLRCAGAAMDLDAALSFWHAMMRVGDKQMRRIKTWTEFIKARFLVDPLYYQHDRSRIIQIPRMMYRERTLMPRDRLARLESLRQSLNALQIEPWNRLANAPETDIRRKIGRRFGSRAFFRHWYRVYYIGFIMNEELLCASMIAFARSSSLYPIHALIFRNFWGVEIVRNPDNESCFLISGGNDMSPTSLIRPTTRTLDAIVEAFGSMSHLAQGLELLLFMSRRYDIPIPAHTWSNLLQWAYVCSSRPFQTMRKVQGQMTASIVTQRHVCDLWKVMTSKPFYVKPTLNDYECYIKTLIVMRQIETALDLIREHMVPRYREIVAQYEKALLDELLCKDVAHLDQAVAEAAIHRRQKLETQRDDVRHRITRLFQALLKNASGTRHRDKEFSGVLIPNLLHEFGDEFFDQTVQYRTAQGVVTVLRPDAPRRLQGAFEWRETLPQNVASMFVPWRRGDDTGQLQWPKVHTLKVMQWRKRWQGRKSLGVAPRNARAPDSKQWWKRLEDRLLV